MILILTSVIRGLPLFPLPPVPSAFVQASLVYQLHSFLG